jgi:uncharacterized protein
MRTLAWFLVMLGAINWGLIGVSGFLGQQWDLVYWVFGMYPPIEGVVFILIGLSALYLIFNKK